MNQALYNIDFPPYTPSSHSSQNPIMPTPAPKPISNNVTHLTHPVTNCSQQMDTNTTPITSELQCQEGQSDGGAQREIPLNSSQTYLPHTPPAEWQTVSRKRTRKTDDLDYSTDRCTSYWLGEQLQTNNRYTPLADETTEETIEGRV